MIYLGLERKNYRLNMNTQVCAYLQSTVIRSSPLGVLQLTWTPHWWCILTILQISSFCQGRATCVREWWWRYQALLLWQVPFFYFHWYCVAFRRYPWHSHGNGSRALNIYHHSSQIHHGSTCCQPSTAARGCSRILCMVDIIKC